MDESYEQEGRKFCRKAAKDEKQIREVLQQSSFLHPHIRLQQTRGDSGGGHV
jgi:hypothetical protein